VHGQGWQSLPGNEQRDDSFVKGDDEGDEEHHLTDALVRPIRSVRAAAAVPGTGGTPWSPVGDVHRPHSSVVQRCDQPSAAMIDGDDRLVEQSAQRSIRVLHLVLTGWVADEELHFGRAADRLKMSQPPLSHAILQLERQLGTTLLNRSSRSVLRTEAGRKFLEQCRLLIAASERAQEVASRPARDF
jgi:Bacterial regulatory helix-turn-helix protein, lysR family